MPGSTPTPGEEPVLRISTHVSFEAGRAAARWWKGPCRGIAGLGLDSLYQRMMEHVYNSNDADLYKQILAIMTTVYRPITVAELTALVKTLKDMSGDHKSRQAGTDQHHGDIVIPTTLTNHGMEVYLFGIYQHNLAGMSSPNASTPC